MLIITNFAPQSNPTKGTTAPVVPSAVGEFSNLLDHSYYWKETIVRSASACYNFQAVYKSNDLLIMAREFPGSR
jgi:hypothetical protein